MFRQPAIRALVASLASDVRDFDIDVLAADETPIAVAMTIRAGRTACS
jgi:hypothetical protein